MSLRQNHHESQFCYGEKTNYVYSWSNDFLSNVMQFHFQMVRGKNSVYELERQLGNLLQHTIDNKYQTRDAWILLYRMIAYTRDKDKGRGEYKLAYMQVFVWFHYYPELAIFAFMHFVMFSKYGSWKDVKLFSNYIYQRTGNEYHPFIDILIDLLVKQLKEDEQNYEAGKSISLAAKWTPREKSKYGWLFKRIALRFSYHLFEDREINMQSRRKAYMNLRRFLSKMNRYTNNTEMLMCTKGYHMIDFSKVSAMTIHKNILAFQNITNNDKLRTTKWDRFIGAGLFRKFMESTNEIRGAPQIQLGTLVKSAIDCKIESKAATINKLWLSNAKQNVPLPPIIPLVDVSSSLEENNLTPLFNAIGFGIRISELTTEPFKNRIMVFSAAPQWIILEGLTFVEKVNAIYNTLRGLKSNIEGVLDVIKNTIVKAEIPPEDIKNLMLCIISDMQFDTFKRKKVWPPPKQGLFDLIREKFTCNHPQCILPKLVFYNIKNAPGMPLVCGERDTYLLAGYNAYTLNNLTSKKKSTKKQISSVILKELQDKRYFPLEFFFKLRIK